MLLIFVQQGETIVEDDRCKLKADPVFLEIRFVLFVVLAESDHILPVATTL